MKAGWSRIAARAFSVAALTACGSLGLGGSEDSGIDAAAEAEGTEGAADAPGAEGAAVDGAAEAEGDALGDATGADAMAGCNNGSVCITSAECPASGRACITPSCIAGCCTLNNAPSETECIGSGGRVCDGAGSCVACLVPGDCPAQATTCKTNTCVTDTCGAVFAAKGVACNDSGGVVCDGQGSCVSMHCMDGVKDADETDVDCGGTTCAPCANTKACLLPRDCASGDCKSLICAACAADTDCANGAYCAVASGICTPTQSQGAKCAAGDQCTTGFCVSGVCCSGACTGTCHGCTQSLTGSTDGICSTLMPGSTAPSGQCAASSSCGNNGLCGAAGVCAQVAAGTTCASASCSGSLYTATSTCNASGTCTPGASENCADAGAVCNATTGCGANPCSTNLALTATATNSGGGSGMFAASDMNNGQATSCSAFAWVTDSTTAGTAWIQLAWPSPVTVASFYINTENGLTGTTPCSLPLGRNVASGTVQTWNGSSWSTVGSFSGRHGDVQYNLPFPTTTPMLRVYGLTTDPGNGNSVIFQWHVYSGTSCTPPP